MKLLKIILNKMHIHRCNQPILSQYWTFHSRRIVYQCKCGKKELHHVHRNFGDAFPIETGIMIENKEVDKVLQNPDVLPEIKTVEDKLKFLWS